MKQNRKEKTEKYHDNSIKVWVLPKQKAAIKGQAAKAGLSVAEYLRKVGMGYPIKSVVDREQIAELSKCRADLGRLGGLLKLWLSPDGVSIHSQLHPPTDSVSADRNRVDCPLPEGRGYWEGMPGFAGRQVGISLKGEASNHKGISGEQGTVGEEGRIRSLLHQIEESQAKLRNVIDRL